MEQLKQEIYSLEQLSRLAAEIEHKKQLHLSGMAGSFRAFVNAYILEKINRPVLYIANDLDSAECLRDDLELLLPAERLSFLPSTEFEPYDHNEASPSVLSLRQEAMQRFLSPLKTVSVATINGLVQYMPAPEKFLARQLVLKTGQHTDFDGILGKLQALGLKREEMVEQVGEFSVRGGIIDLYVWNFANPLRIEFFGDQIESIRAFDVLSQRSTEQLEEMRLLPNFFHRKGQHVFIDELLAPDTVVFVEDTDLAKQKAEQFFKEAGQIFERNLDAGVEEKPPDSLYMSGRKFSRLLGGYSLLESDLLKKQDIPEIRFTAKPHPSFNGSIKLFLDYLAKQSRHKPNPQIRIQCSTPAQAERLQDIIDENELNFNGKLMSVSLHQGFLLAEKNLQILTDHEIFNRFKRRRTYKRFKSGEYLRQLSRLNANDFVVHIDYGIGRYLGLEMLDLGSVKKECIKIAYKDGDHLFVTVDRLNRVQKYSSEQGGQPHLTKLGTAEWERLKKKTKESLKKVAAELIGIYAGRKALGGFRFSPDNQWQKELEASFVFEETEDQLKSIAEVKADMEDDRPMDRLLCGDVGFGKTEVALRAAFKAVLEGKQAAVLVPTTILAFQHYETFRSRLAEFPVNLALLNRFRTAREQQRIVRELAEGKIDLIIGTHRLLSDDVKFKDLGLLVIDEEQRFGVRQKEKLKKYRLSVDILSMTATPIPRSLHMALLGARDLSNIDTPPHNRLPVHTEIIQWNDRQLQYIINKEIDRGGQVFFVHNRVETILAVKETLARIVPGARIAVGHGQLPDRRLERVMLDFMNKKYDVLLATMIIENGLDIPNVNTIIINRADKFGLAQLYQLRGRVGRSKEQAFAYLLTPAQDKLTATARKRLRAIQDFTDLGSGYKVALKDLEIRGAGNLLGKEQSGYVNSVGFDMYCRILDEAVEELKQGGQNGRREVASPLAGGDIKLDADFDLLIPATYISSEMERISVYHRLVNFSDTQQIEALETELQDRFGRLPGEVRRFLKTMEIKILANQLSAGRIVLKKNILKIFFSDALEKDDHFYENTMPALLAQQMTKVKFSQAKGPAVEIELHGEDVEQRLGFAKKLLQKVTENA